MLHYFDTNISVSNFQFFQKKKWCESEPFFDNTQSDVSSTRSTPWPQRTAVLHRTTSPIPSHHCHRRLPTLHCPLYCLAHHCLAISAHPSPPRPPPCLPSPCPSPPPPVAALPSPPRATSPVSAPHWRRLTITTLSSLALAVTILPVTASARHHPFGLATNLAAQYSSLRLPMSPLAAP